MEQRRPYAQLQVALERERSLLLQSDTAAMNVHHPPHPPLEESLPLFTTIHPQSFSHSK